MSRASPPSTSATTTCWPAWSARSTRSLARTASPTGSGWSATSGRPPGSRSSTCTCTSWAAAPSAGLPGRPRPVPISAPYGSWASPISLELVSSAGVGLDELVTDGDAILWLEGRPLDGGRQVLCRRLPGGEPHDVTGAGRNVRTRVHEYGGGAYIAHRGTVFFCDYTDQRLYRQDEASPPRPITPEPAGAPASLRYADTSVTPDGAWIVCVRESHDGPTVSNELVALPSDGSAGPRVLASGRDFYA